MFFTYFPWRKKQSKEANESPLIHFNDFLFWTRQTLSFGRHSRSCRHAVEISLSHVMWRVKTDLLSEEGRDLGGSILMVGSHSPGGSTITSSRNSSMPASRSCRSLALYAMSWKIWADERRDVPSVRGSRSTYTPHVNNYKHHVRAFKGADVLQRTFDQIEKKDNLFALWSSEVSNSAVVVSLMSYWSPTTFVIIY